MKDHFILIMASLLMLLNISVAHALSANPGIEVDKIMVPVQDGKQKNQVTGIVTDKSGQTIPGVSVIVKGTTIGTTTDSDGKYFISVPDQNAVLEFSYLGYGTHEIAVAGQSKVDISISESSQDLDEVVIVGYGIQKKETVVGAVSTVKGSELAKTPVANLSNALIGRLSGVVTTQRSGEPGYDGATIRIRGSNTLGNNDPLVVIDGVAARAGGLERLDPNEVENISVLKDASAAIYGARAANGVILITTKKGKAGKKAEITYTFNQGWTAPTILPKMANAAEYAELRNELIINDAAVNPLSGETPSIKTPWKTEEEIQKFRDGSDPWRYPNTDWYGETFRPWTPQNIQNVSLEGGSQSASYFATFGYKSQDGMYHNSATNYKQYNLRINLDAEINQWMKLGVNLMGREEDRLFPTQGAGDILWFAARGRPTDPAYWPNGLPGPAQEYGRNPVVAVTDQTGYDKSKQYYIQTNANLEITQPWVPGLKFTATVSYDKRLSNSKEFFQPWYLYTWDYKTMQADGVTPKLEKALSYPNHADPDLSMTSSDQTNMVLGGILSYDKKFGNHGVGIVAGSEKDQSDNSYFSAYRRYFLSTAVQVFQAGGDKEKTNGSGGAGDNWQRARLNYFGRFAYNYKEKYLAEFVWRNDASYMFPEDTRYGFFPGILLGYRISEEDFWKKNLSFIEYFKLRGSWGQMGNDAVWYGGSLQEYQYLSTFKYEWGYIVDNQDEKGLAISRFPNKNITWERANNLNLGIEGRILNSRLYFEMDFFYNKRNNIMWQRNASIPQTAGLTLPAENIGKVNNSGFDFKIDWHDRIGSDFVYNISLTGGYAKNKIIFWDESAGAKEWQKSTGHPMNTDIYYVFDGVFMNWDEINDKASRPNYDGVTSDEDLQPGDMKFKDIDGNGEITPDDRRRFDKTNEPKWVGGLNFMMQWKNFDMSLLFQGAADSWQKLYFDSGEIGNYRKFNYDNHWSEDNQIANHPRIYARGKYYWDSGTGSNNTYWMNNTDYVRLKSIELGYTLPGDIIKRTKFFNKARVYVSGLNLFTLTNALELDPESSSNAGTNYPQTKVINFGFMLTF